MSVVSLLDCDAILGAISQTLIAPEVEYVNQLSKTDFTLVCVIHSISKPSTTQSSKTDFKFDCCLWQFAYCF